MCAKKRKRKRNIGPGEPGSGTPPRPVPAHGDSALDLTGCGLTLPNGEPIPPQLLGQILEMIIGRHGDEEKAEKERKMIFLFRELATTDPILSKLQLKDVAAAWAHLLRTSPEILNDIELTRQALRPLAEAQASGEIEQEGSMEMRKPADGHGSGANI